MPINMAPKEFNPNAIDLNARLGSVRKEHLDAGIFPFDWFEFESPPTGSPTYDKHRLKLKDFAVLQAGFVGLTINELLYLHTDGDYTQNVATLGTGEYVVILGVATSATEVEISLGQPILWDQYNAVTYIEDQDGYVAAGGTKTPSVPTISVCEAVATKAIRIVWDAQRNLTNFDRYELQVSDDDATWYSLEVDGSDWKDTLNADTDHDVEMYVHSGIPHDVTGGVDAPVGQTLYYKVRRITKAGGAPGTSNYSASASAATNVVAAGDLAANSIYVNNLLAATVETMLLRSAAIYVGYDGTGSWDDPDDGDRRVYIDDDEIKIQYYDTDTWKDRIHLGYQVMKAYDENDVVIHDIPPSPVAAGVKYAGHILPSYSAGYIDSYNQTYTDTETDRAVAGTLQNLNISAILTALGVTNAHGLMLFAFTKIFVAGAKVLPATEIVGAAKYSLTYNTACPTYALMGMASAKSQSADADNYDLQYWNGSTAFAPVVYSGATPYLTWQTYMNVSDMKADNAQYQVLTYLYLTGLLV